MKRQLLMFLVALSGFSMVSCQAMGQKSKDVNTMFRPDSAAYKSLGKSLSTLLFAPSSVRCYAVRNVRQPSQGDLAFEENFVLGAQIQKLTTRETAVLQYLIPANPENYHVDSVMVKSPYMPRLAFEFAKGKQKAWLLVSLSDSSWSVYYDDKNQFNFNYEDTKAIERFCAYYMHIQETQETQKTRQ